MGVTLVFKEENIGGGGALGESTELECFVGCFSRLLLWYVEEQ